MAEGGTTLEYTPTWVVAAVCTVIVVISFAVERFLHYMGKLFKKKNQKPLFEALQKIKEELMLLGFISLLLTVCQGTIAKICISEELATIWLPCKKRPHAKTKAHFVSSSIFPDGIGRHLLAEESSSEDYCHKKGKVPLLSVTALHHLHIFIFVLAVAHVTFCALTILFGGIKIRQWKHWEESILKEKFNDEELLQSKFTHVREHSFIRNHYLGVGKSFKLLSWLQSFCKQFRGSVNQSDYTTLRLAFVMNHCRGNRNFNFHKYMMRVLESDFKKVVGISWYLWVFVIVFLLVNVYGWHAYFYISFIPFILLLTVGTKLEHVMTEMAHVVAEKHVAVEGELVVKPSDEHFWLNRPRFILLLIHIILFQNSFELAIFFWIWIQYKFNSCIMGDHFYIIPRLIIGVFVQFLCSYSTLPLYAIVTQMGTSFKKEIFDQHIQVGLVGWAKQAKKNTVLRKAANGNDKSPSHTIHMSQVTHKEDPPTVAVQLGIVNEDGSAMKGGDIVPDNSYSAVPASPK